MRLIAPYIFLVAMTGFFLWLLWPLLRTKDNPEEEKPADKKAADADIHHDQL